MATAFGRVITLAQIPSDLATTLTNLSDNPIVLLLLINLLLLVIWYVHGNHFVDHHHDIHPAATCLGAGR